MVAFEHCVQLDYAASAYASHVKEAEKRPELCVSLHDAEKLLGRDDPQAVDAGALMLDGLLGQLVSEWFAARGADAPSREQAMDELERREGCDGPFVWRLRLALRSHNPHVRLVHCWELLRHINSAEGESGS